MHFQSNVLPLMLAMGGSVFSSPLAQNAIDQSVQNVVNQAEQKAAGTSNMISSTNSVCGNGAPAPGPAPAANPWGGIDSSTVVVGNGQSVTGPAQDLPALPTVGKPGKPNSKNSKSASHKNHSTKHKPQTPKRRRQEVIQENQQNGQNTDTIVTGNGQSLTGADQGITSPNTMPAVPAGSPSAHKKKKPKHHRKPGMKPFLKGSAPKAPSARRYLDGATTPQQALQIADQLTGGDDDAPAAASDPSQPGPAAGSTPDTSAPAPADSAGKPKPKPSHKKKPHHAAGKPKTRVGVAMPKGPKTAVGAVSRLPKHLRRAVGEMLSQGGYF
ncbi:hypothetical protein MMC13_005168 [Lambiella insularis]|nr:hypothetical protein [Lambiella insularis]